jgi:threonine aldolase
MPVAGIDLRSDTVTLPSPEMRRAMGEAELGDDVFEDDPTVRRLEELAAAKVGKETALFVPSGTMANLIAILVHCERGTEAIVGAEAHMIQSEVAGGAVVGGVQLRTVPNDIAGRISLADVRAAIRTPNVHHPVTRLVAIENTHNRCYGTPIGAEDTAAVAQVAREHGLAFHIDGARIFNAAVALRVPVTALTAPADTVSFCLSKGLSAPIGSLICGPRDLIARARGQRKMLGGGMRQVGVLAAAGIVALETMVDRLAEDHANARALAEGLAGLPGVTIDPALTSTNIVIFDVEGTAAAWLGRVAAEGVHGVAFGPNTVRLTTHFGITRDDIDEALKRIEHAVALAPA